MSTTPLTPKTVRSSAIHDQTYKIFPNDLNSYGTAFGGIIMKIMDRTALVVAERHCTKTCVTVSIDAVHFLAPAVSGDVLIFKSSINRSWTTSMEVGIRVEAENSYTGNTRHILSAYFTFVAVDAKGCPTPVPPVLAETPVEKRRYEEANDRRQQRITQTKLRQERRAQNPTH